MTLQASYFDRLYEFEPDPWDFRSRPYEVRKRALTLACLPEAHYSTAFEPGCSIGVLTSDLAARSDEVLSMDLSALALASAREAVPPNVELRQGAVPADWPTESFELVVLSEVGYYLDRDACGLLADRAMSSTQDLIAVHWRHPVREYPLTGDEVHAVLDDAAQARGLARLVSHVEADFRLDVWSSDSRSVATRGGLVAP